MKTEQTPVIPTASPERKERAFGGLLVRDSRWHLSLRAKVLLLLLLAAGGCAIVVGVYPFLAITRPVKSDTLVMEGWVHPYAARFTAEELERGGYEHLFTTGGPVIGKGGYVNDFQTSASVGRDLLRKEGVAAERLEMVPCRVIGRDRTYSSAVALREWLQAHHLEIHSLNVVTQGTHARRTRLLFSEALGPGVKVGVFSVSSPDYEARRWWHYSEGLQDVIEESLGYLYAKLFFHPRAGAADAISRAVISLAPSLPRTMT